MTTFDTDMARLFMAEGSVTVPLRALGLEWPPPERITHLNGAELPEPMTRRQCSQLTDDAIAASAFLARGCVYRRESDLDDRT